jgi:4'-phosphopantetheinyl transferase EntD
LSKILPVSVVCSEQIGTLKGSLLPEEAELLGPGTVPGRVQEFAAGRTCARIALESIGVSPRPLLMGRRREPLWPLGVTGSITHCKDYCAAAVVSTQHYVGIGIDAEPNRPLPLDVLEIVSVSSERDWLSRCSNNSLCWDRLLFSIKESIYKAWFQVTQQWLGFDQAIVEIQSSTRTFTAAIQHLDVSFPKRIEGSYLATSSLLLTSAWVPSIATTILGGIRHHSAIT